MAMTRSAPEEGAADSELTDRPATPDRDRLAALQVTELRTHVTGRKDVGQEQDLFVAQPSGDLQRADIGKRHPQYWA